MKNSKLVRFLSLIDSSEYKSLLRFAGASLVHEDARIPKLLRWILGCLDKNETAAFSKTEAYRSVFGKMGYNDTDLRVLMTKALQTVLEFISYREFRKNGRGAAHSIISLLIRKNEHDLLSKYLKESESNLRNEPVKDQKFYLDQFELEDAKYTYASRMNQNFEFDTIFSSIENFYFYLKLKFFCIKVNNKFVFNQSVDIQFLNEIRDYVLGKRFSANPAMRCYCHAILLQADEHQIAHLETVQQILKENTVSISQEDLRILSKLAENYCVRKINKGHQEFYEVLHHLLTDRFQRENQLSAAEFKNYVTVCLRSDRTSDLLHFMKAFRNRIIPAEIREDAFNYNEARYFFFLKNFDRVLKLLHSINYFDVFYKIDSKKLLIQTFYELKEWDSLESAMNAFRVFIHRNNAISEVHKLNNQHFINHLYKLIPLQGGNHKKLSKLRHSVNVTEALAEREWLLQKIGELEPVAVKSG